MAAYTNQGHGSTRLWYLARVLMVVAALMGSPFVHNRPIRTEPVAAGGAAELLVLIGAYVAVSILMFRRLRWVSGLAPAARAMLAFGLGLAAYVVLAVVMGPTNGVLRPSFCPRPPRLS